MAKENLYGALNTKLDKADDQRLDGLHERALRVLSAVDASIDPQIRMERELVQGVLQAIGEMTPGKKETIELVEETLGRIEEMIADSKK